MAAWTDTRRDRIAGAHEIEIAPRRGDGSIRPATTIWVVRVGDELFVRSWNGTDGSWYRSARSGGGGRLRVGDTEYDVALTPADDIDRAAIDAAYRHKYGRSTYVDAMVDDGPAATTLRVTPATSDERTT